jgi:hypothetical protein
MFWVRGDKRKKEKKVKFSSTMKRNCKESNLAFEGGAALIMLSKDDLVPLGRALVKIMALKVPWILIKGKSLSSRIYPE